MCSESSFIKKVRWTPMFVPEPAIGVVALDNYPTENRRNSTYRGGLTYILTSNENMLNLGRDAYDFPR
jgi:hypothetical protein